MPALDRSMSRSERARMPPPREAQTARVRHRRRKPLTMLKEYGGCGLILLAGLAFLVLLACLFQSKLIYYPHRYSPGELLRAAEDFSLRPWPARDGDYRGLVADRPGGVRGTVVVFHGAICEVSPSLRGARGPFGWGQLAVWFNAVLHPLLAGQLAHVAVGADPVQQLVQR